MTGFQDQLDKELDRRGLKPDEAPDATPTKIKQAKYFSFGSFFLAFSLGGLVLGILIALAMFNAKDTAEMSIEKLASKTAIVEETYGQVYSGGGSQTVLKMPGTQQDNAKTENTNEPAPEKEKINLKPIPRLSDEEKNKSRQGGMAKISDDGELTEAPIANLFESGNNGLLPVIRELDGLTSFEAYQRPYSKSGKPTISFVVTDLGLSSRVAQNIIESLPAGVSLAFTPYGSNVKPLVKTARAEGHEVWLQLPLETKDYPLVDTGPLTILKAANLKQSEERLKKALSSFSGYVGVIAGKDHIYTTEDATINPTFKNIFERGLAIIDSNISLYSFVSDLASKDKYPQTKNNFWFDEDLRPVALNQKLRQIMEYSRARKSVIVMTGPSPAAINAIKKFISSDAANDFELAPVSSQVTLGE